MSNLAELFVHSEVDLTRMKEIELMQEPRRRYIIAMTPRSGSSYLCDVLTRSRRFGLPGEFLNQEFLPNIMVRIPGRTPGEYFRNVARVRKTSNGIYGLKASWFQFKNFVEILGNDECLSGYKFIYLTRRNLAAQAVSLYKATSSSVFHTNKKHDADAVSKLESLGYDFDEINRWYEHIERQEQGWQEYFRDNRINPCCISYEEIDADVQSVVMKIAVYLGVNPSKVTTPSEPSVFAKVSDRRNLEWSCRYLLERSERNSG